MNARKQGWVRLCLLWIGLTVGQVDAQTPPQSISVADQTVAPGGTARFNPSVSGVGPLTYQWIYNGIPIFVTNFITTVAGSTNLFSTYSGDGGAATNAGLWHPTGVAVDSAGNFYIADKGNKVIRRVDTNDVITTVAGNFRMGGTYTGDGGAATNAGLYLPNDIVVDGAGNLYIADTYNNVVRRVDASGTISTVAGNFSLGGSYSGDGGAATDAGLSYPSGVALDGLGDLYISENGNNVVRKVDPTGNITTVAGDFTLGGTYWGDGGPATNAGLWLPNAVAVDRSGNLYIADNGNQVIRKVDTNGVITTVAGNYVLGDGYSGDGDVATDAALNSENGVAVDGWGNIFIADTMNNVVRQVDPNGIITTVAGNFNLGGNYSGDGGAATNAALRIPIGAGLDATGNLYIADSYNGVIRKVTFANFSGTIQNGALTIPDVQTSVAGKYQVIVSNPYGSITSSIVTLSVQAAARDSIHPVGLGGNPVLNGGIFGLGGPNSANPLISSNPPVITLQPTNLTVIQGSNATFSVTAINGTLSYQWWFNGTNLLPGLTNSMFTLTNVAATNAGTYFVIVTNSAGSVTSSNAVLAVLTPPAITVQPTNQTVIQGASVTFIVSASGGLLNYQWWFNGTSLLAGQTNSALVLTNAQSANAGSYFVVVSNLAGSINSSNAVLTVNPPSCDTPPSGLVSWWRASSNANDSVGPNEGTWVGTVAYTNGEVGQAFAVSTNNYISIPDSASLDQFSNKITIEFWTKGSGPTNNWFSMVCKTDSGYEMRLNDHTNTASFFINGLSTGNLVGTRNIHDGNWHHIAGVYDGTNMYLYVDGTLDTQQANTGTINCAVGTALDIGTAPNYTSARAYTGLIDEVSIYNTALSASQVAGIYSAGSTGKCPPSPPYIISQPTNQAAVLGGAASFNVTAAGWSPLSYQWIFNGTNLSGATNATLNLTGLQLSQAGNYDVVITNVAGSVTSSNAALTVLTSPTITTQPTNQTVIQGSNAAFSVTVTGGALNYRWWFNGTNLLAGQTNFLLTLTNVSLVNAGSYCVTITNLAGSVISSNALLTVLTLPVITLQPTNLTVIQGTNVIFSVTANGGALNYQWWFNGTNQLAGQTNSVLALTNVQPANAGSYLVVISNLAGSIISSNASLSLLSPPVIIQQPANQTAVSAATAVFSVGATGTTALWYEWLFNGTPLVYSNIITTIAGIHGVSGGYTGGGDLALNSRLNAPQAVALSGSGAVFIADTGNNVIRKINPDGTMATVAGNYLLGPGYSGDGSTATNAQLYLPSGVAVDASGNLYIADTENNIVRKVNTNGIITTVAGIYNEGGGYSGDGSPGTNAQLDTPVGLAFDSHGNLFIADSGNQAIRELSGGGIIQTVAGNGTWNYLGDGGAATNSSLNWPMALTIDGFGNMYIADSGNHVIRKVGTNGIITTVIGSGLSGYSGDGGAASAAFLSSPVGVTIDYLGNIYIADSSDNAIREVNSSGIITTFAGSKTLGAGYSGDGGGPASSQLDSPEGVLVDSLGNLYIADTANNVIRKVASTGSINEATGTLTITNAQSGQAGNYQVIVTNLYGSATSSIVTLTVNVPPTITTQPTNVNILTNQNTSLRAIAVGTSPMSWQWYSNSVPLAGATSNSLTFLATITNDSANYFVVVTNFAGSATSSVASLAVLTPPVITGEPTNPGFVSGGSITLSVQASGGDFSWQWLYDGVDIMVTNIITTVAGNDGSPAGYSGDGGLATSAELEYPYGVAVDAAGNFYFADSNNDVIRKVGTNGIVTTVAGDYALGNGYSGDGFAATSAQLDYPEGIAVDGHGDLFIADASSSVIREVYPNGTIGTVAGNYLLGAGYGGDGGPAVAAQLNYPSGVALDSVGNLYIADTWNNVIRKVNQGGIITTVAGSGSQYGDGGAATNAALSGPTAVAFDASGNLYISDSGNNVVRKVSTSGIITTFAGKQSLGPGYSGDGGAATNAALNNPAFLTLDGFGNLYISEAGNNVVRMVTNGIISTMAGNHGHGAGYGGDNGAATNAQLNLPRGVAFAAPGILYIADYNNNIVRKIAPSSLVENGTLIIPGALTNQSGNYQVIVSNPCGSVTSAVLNVAVAIAPAITQEPAGVLAAPGQNVSFSATAVGQAPLRWQWYSNSVPLTGMTNNALNINSVITNDSANYFVVVSNIAAAVTSSIAPLSVMFVPVITLQASNQTVVAGSNVNIVYAGSGGGLAWEWLFDGMELFPSNIITTVAGNDEISYTGDGGPATNAFFASPCDAIADGHGNLFVSDNGAFVIRKISPAGLVSTVAGIFNGGGYSGDGGLATNAELYYPGGICLDAVGNLYIADIGNSVVRKVDTNGYISTVAGNGTFGNSGNGGTATNASLGSPTSVTVNSAGILFIVDSYYNVVRMVSTNGLITVVAGNGTSGYAGDGGMATNAEFESPSSIAVDAPGNLYIADTYNNRIRKVNTGGTITTVAGNGIAGYAGDGSAATAANINAPSGVTVDGSGNLYITDKGNNVVRKFTVGGNISTIAGTNSLGGGYSGDGSAAILAQLNSPQSVCVGSSGVLYVADTGNGVIRSISGTGNITTAAGSYGPNVVLWGNGGPATISILSSPYGVAADTKGNFYIADQGSSLVLKVNADGVISVVAGTNHSGYSGDGLPATAAKLNNPNGVAVDGLGNVFIADSGNERIRKVGTNGIITMVAGNGATGYTGDGGSATNAEMYNPVGVGVDAVGNLYIADEYNYVVRKVTTNGIITTVAGNGTAGYNGDGASATNASLSDPTAVVPDAYGNLYIADYGNSVIRKVNVAGMISTVAGLGNQSGYSGDGGSATNAQLSSPYGVTVDGAGDLFVSDYGNAVIREISATGNIQTVAGNHTRGYSGDGGAPTNAEINYPEGIAIDAVGNVYVADSGEKVIRRVSLGALNGNEIITNGTLSIGNVTTNAAGAYQVIASNSCGSVTSSIATLTVLVPPIITQDPATQYIQPGGSATFSAVAAGTAPFGWQWYSNSIPLMGANSSVLTFTTATTNDSGSYFVVVTSAVGAATSSVAIFGVMAPPVISVEPTNQSISGGVNTTIGLTSSGADLSYEWLLDGTNIVISNIITTVAGNYSLGAGYSGDGGMATNAALDNPSDVAVDSTGNVYFSDTGNNVIRKLDTLGRITTFAGTSIGGYQGDGGAATNAWLSVPAGIFIDGSGNLYIADSGNNVIRKVDPTGRIETVAGDGEQDYSGDGGAATNASFSGPAGVVVDGAGDIFIADTGNNVIRKVGTNGVIQTFAGTGSFGYSGDGGNATNALLVDPAGIAVDSTGCLYIADNINNVIRKVNTNGIISTVAGNFVAGRTLSGSGDGGSATNAGLAMPYGIAVDGSGNIYISDTYDAAIRVVDSHGIISTFAGNGNNGYSGDGGSATNALLNEPCGVCVGSLGRVYIADSRNNVIRQVMPTYEIEGGGLTINDAITNDAGTYEEIISNPCGSVTSSVVTITIKVPPLITQEPVGTNIMPSQFTSLTVAAAGTSPMFWQWYSNSVPLVGATSSSLTFASTTTNESANYFVVVTNVGGAATSSVANLTVMTRPVITSQPTNQTSVVGTSFSLGVGATGGGLSWQWLFDGSDIVVGNVITTVAGNFSLRGGYSGDLGWATNAALSQPSGVQTDSSGNLYIADTVNHAIRKVATNGIITTVAGNSRGGGYSGDGGAATNATLAYPAGIAVDQNGNLYIADSANNVIRRVNTNGIITTVVGVAGSGSYSGDGGPATNAYLNNPTCVVMGQNGNFYIADSGNNVVRQVNSNGIITTVAGNYYGGDGFTYNDGSVATNQTTGDFGDGGMATNAMLWNPTGLALDTAGNLWIADNSDCLIRKVGLNGRITTMVGNKSENAGYFGDGGNALFARLNNPYGIALDGNGNLFIADTGNNVVRRVGTNGVIMTVGGNFILGGGYSGDGGVATNAQLNSPRGLVLNSSGNLYIADTGDSVVRGVTFANFGISSNGSLIILNGATNLAGTYQVVISNACGSVTSSVAALTMVQPVAPSFSQQPTNQTVLAGAGASFSVATGGLPSPNYQWYFNSNVLAGATNQTLILSAAQTNNSGVYSALIYNVAGSVMSSNATLTVVATPQILLQPTNLTVIQGSNAALNVIAAGGGLHCQWYYNGTNAFAGATNVSLVLTNVATTNAGTWHVIITNIVGSVTSSNATLTVLSTPVIITQPVNQNVAAGSNAIFSVTASGGNLSYLWRFNGTPLSWGTAATLVLTNVQPSSAGNYSVIVTNLAGATSSANAVLTLGTAPTITSQPVSQTLAQGGNPILSVTATGGALSYFWWFNGNLFPGGTNASLTVTNAQLTNAGAYYVVVSNNLAAVTSSNAILTICAPVQITAQPTNLTVLAGNSAAFNVTATGGGLGYWWWFNGTNLIAGATNASLSWADTLGSFAGTYSVVVSNMQGAVTSSGAVLTVLGPPFFTLEPVNEPALPAQNTTFVSSVGGTAPVGCQWYSNSLPIIGATGGSLTISNVSSTNLASYYVVATNVYGSSTSSIVSLQIQSLLADYDYDGRNNGQELTDGTDPFNPNSAIGVQLSYLPFDQTNTWAASAGQVPLLATNVIGVPSWDTNAALIDNPSGALLSYRDVETNGNANINIRCGTVSFWFKPDWSSVNLGGGGPGGSGSGGRLIEMGYFNPITSPTNSNMVYFTNGWWSLYLTVDGNQIAFGSSTNGFGRTNLTSPVSLTSNQWCQIVLTYTPTNSLLYLNGQLLTNGLGSIYYPNPTERSAGFRIGSDQNGANQGRGVFDDLAAYNYPLSAATIATVYNQAVTLDSNGDGLSNILANELGLNPYGYFSPNGLTTGNGLQVFTPLK